MKKSFDWAGPRDYRQKKFLHILCIIIASYMLGKHVSQTPVSIFYICCVVAIIICNSGSTSPFAIANPFSTNWSVQCNDSSKSVFMSNFDSFAGCSVLRSCCTVCFFGRRPKLRRLAVKPDRAAEKSKLNTEHQASQRAFLCSASISSRTSLLIFARSARSS